MIFAVDSEAGNRDVREDRDCFRGLIMGGIILLISQGDFDVDRE